MNQIKINIDVRKFTKNLIVHIFLVIITLNVYLTLHYFTGISGDPNFSLYFINHNFKSNDILIGVLTAISAEIAYHYISMNSFIFKSVLIGIALNITVGCITFYLLFNYSEKGLSTVQPIIELSSINLVYFIHYLVVRGFWERKIIVIKQELNTKSLKYKQLYAQSNPHFFFNTLNSILSLSIQENAKKTSDSLVLFSEIMRYNMSKTDLQVVKLDDELEFIKAYIDLQKLRIDPKTHLKISIENNSYDQLRIATMLFTVFIENAFRYGNSAIQSSKIEIQFMVSEHNVVSFTCKNTKSSDLRSNIGNGTGIKLSKEQLQLFYPNKHELTILEDQLTFEVRLNLNLN